MLKKLRVGVLFGGRSTEHQVSLVSAQSVMSALDPQKYDIIPIGITPSGRWLTGADALELLKSGQEPERRCFLPADPTVRGLLNADNLQAFEMLDVVFPALHGSFGEDGTVQGLLELADIPYVGANVLGSSLAMDKILQKLICRQAGLPTVDFLWFRSQDWHENSAIEQPTIAYQLANLPQEQMIKKIKETLGFPVFVKPPNLGSSVGITKAHDRQELIAGIELACRYDRKVLVETAAPNAREIEVAVLGNERPRASVPGEIIPSNEFYDYDAKYVDGASEIRIPAELPTELLDALRETAVRSVIACEVEGMARVDFLINSKTFEFFLNEINTIPGFTSISMYPKMWEASGLSYSALLDELIRLAIDRAQKRRALSTTFQPSKEWYR